MPAAPSLEALFDTQAVVETALSTYLTANGLTAYTSQTTDNLPDARIICEYQVGPSAGHQANSSTTNTGAPELDWFNGVINFTVQTERAVVGASPDAEISGLHAYWVARLRVLMLRGAINGQIDGIDALALPYHRIVLQGFLGAQDSVPADGMDETIVGYSVQVQILPDAWPEIPN